MFCVSSQAKLEEPQDVTQTHSLVNPHPHRMKDKTYGNAAAVDVYIGAARLAYTHSTPNAAAGRNSRQRPPSIASAQYFDIWDKLNHHAVYQGQNTSAIPKFDVAHLAQDPCWAVLCLIAVLPTPKACLNRVISFWYASVAVFMYPVRDLSCSSARSARVSACLSLRPVYGTALMQRQWNMYGSL